MCFFFFKQKTAYEMRISDWSSDVCSSDLKEIQRLERLYALAWGQSQQRDRAQAHQRQSQLKYEQALDIAMDQQNRRDHAGQRSRHLRNANAQYHSPKPRCRRHCLHDIKKGKRRKRSEEHTSELQSLMRISSAVFCLKKKTNK